MNTNQLVNRVENDLNQWRLREERFTKLFPFNLANNRAFLKEKLNYLDRVAAKYKGTVNQEERIALRILKQERNEIGKHLYPNLMLRLLRGILLTAKQQYAVKEIKKQAASNEQVLKETLVKTGFGNVSNKLEQYMKQEQQEFSIPVSYYVNEKEQLNFSLSFSKDQNGQYQFESYKAILKNDDKPGESRLQNFSIEPGNTITATQAYNLLAGRSVQKEDQEVTGNKQPGWVQLDFNDKDAVGNYRIKEFNTSYGYDLKSVLQQLPLKELSDSIEGEKLENALTSGSRHAVSFLKDGKEQTFFIEANPQFKSVNIYDEHLKKISVASALGNKTAEPAQLAKKTNLRQEITEEKKKGLSIR